jgi:hypothetical protein
LEIFWNKYLQAAGANLKAFGPVLLNFGGRVSDAGPLINSRIYDVALRRQLTMNVWPDWMELLRLNNAGDRLYLKHLFDGTIITGNKGSGKTSATAAHLHAALLTIGCGGVVPCPKYSDFGQYSALINRLGRGGDVIPMRPPKTWDEKPINALNILDVEQKVFGQGRADVGNVTALLMRVIDFMQRKNGQGGAGGDTAFWRNYAEKIIKAGLTIQSINSNRFDLKDLLRFVGSLPETVEQSENQNLYSVGEVQKAAAKLGENPPYEFMSAFDFVVSEWPGTPPNARGSGSLTVRVLLDTLLSFPLRQLFFEESTFDLDRLNHGGIVLLDMDVQRYAHGALAGMILKDLVSRWCQARPELTQLPEEQVPPIFLLYDEAAFYLVDEDEGHARSARSARLIPIFITQTTTSLKAQFHDKDKAQNLLDLAGCRFAHSSGSAETNTWMADTIGKVVVERRGHQEGTNWNFGPQFQHGRNEGHNYNQQKDYDCDPRLFTRLLRGGVENKLKVECILWRNGDKFHWNKRRWLPTAFRQDFRPGYDEVRVTAKAMTEGGSRGQVFASNLFDSAAQAGRQRLRSLFR